ncbi:MAG: polyphenol oxidase family protein [Acidothermaceae bacterium]
MVRLGSLGNGVHYVYTDRGGGFSAPPFDCLNLSYHVGDDANAVTRNRELVAQRAGFVRAVWLRAQHGNAVGFVERSVPLPADGEPPEVDALVTTEPGLAVGSLSADCVLIVLADPATGVVGTAHCGRPGLLAGIVEATVRAMRSRGAGVVRAAIGPSICGSCYEVPRPMADEVTASVPAAAAISRTGTAALDIGAGVAAQLSACDVQIVRRVGGCTREDPALFSYRRDGVTGRLGALVWRAA